MNCFHTYPSGGMLLILIYAYVYTPKEILIYTIWNVSHTWTIGYCHCVIIACCKIPSDILSFFEVCCLHCLLK